MSVEKVFASLNEDGVHIENLINGEFSGASDDTWIESVDPATGRVWAYVPDSTAEDVNRAVEAAKEAFVSWSETSPKFRANILNRIGDGVERRLAEFARFESRDQGKPVSLAAQVDIPRCIHNFRFFATAILHDTNESLVQKEPCTAVNYVVKEPVGVAGLVSPWNLPLYLLSFKVAPALAAGNTVVAKPSEFTSVTAWLLAHVFQEAGVPCGVVNFVFGTGRKTGEALVGHPDVPLVSFTGSTATGCRISEMAAPYYKKLSLELGGKNACIVFEDFNREKHMATILRSCFANQGEICLASSRLFVQETIFDSFVQELAEAAKRLVVGDPTDSLTNLGPLVSRQHLEKVRSFITLAEAEGAIFHAGTEPLNLPEEMKQGFFLRPVVLSGVSDDSRLMQDEIFGPVVCVTHFKSESEVIRRANAVPYGLSATVFSENLGRVHRVAQGLKVGTVWCNCWLVRELNMPFGGTKSSGVGREGAVDSLEFFTEKKNIVVYIN